MNRHVARCHLDLAQLWRCPVSSWCTVWKGAPQDLMDHVLRSPQGAGRGPTHQTGDAFPAVDGYTPGAYRLADVATLRDLQ